MNILLATDANVERAGVCLFMLQWIENIRKLDRDINICAYFRKGILDEAVAQQYRDNDVELVLGELPQDQTSTSSSNRDKVRSDICSILEKKKYDVLHVNSSAVGFTSLVLTEGKKARVPVRISHSHGKNINSFIKRVYLWPIKKYNKHLATKYAGCSIAAGEYLASAVAPDVFNQVGKVNERVAVVLATVHSIVAGLLLVAHRVLAGPTQQQVD